MGRKATITLSLWFVLVMSVVVVAHVPLSYWKSTIQRELPPDIFIEDIAGNWWEGQAVVQLHNLKGNVSINWSISSVWQPIEWRVSHEKFHGLGQILTSLSHVELWLDGFTIEADTFNGLMRRERISIDGAPIVVSRWYAKWQFEQQQFTAFRGNAEWEDGVVQYPMGSSLKKSTFSDWQLLGRLDASTPDVLLRSSVSDYLAGVKLLPSNELEITVMPAMIEAMGQRWNGSSEYPAFVMIQPLF